MYLKALEIQGFKSFPDKTTLTFEKDITAIVGPNGSGKSNISDAMLWVMGEQRSKALRGGKMEDVIFGGTEKRSPLGFAQVSLVLDNSKGLFDIDTSEVTITRRYYRSGESEYYLNREAVRLKDITSLLMDTGLGRDGYSVIGQGRIAEIVSAKSSDRREIFEEAAGISRFRFRKEEAERKLDRTEDNLLRINDKIDELEIQVGPLEKQAETAKKYLILRDEQRQLEISVWTETLDHLHVQSETITADYNKSMSDLSSAQKDLEVLYTDAEEFSASIMKCDLDAEELRNQLSKCDAEIAEYESSSAVLLSNIQHTNDNISRIQIEIEEQSGRSEGIRSQISEHEQRIESISLEMAENLLRIRDLQGEEAVIAKDSDLHEKGITLKIEKENSLNDEITKARTTVDLLVDRENELTDRVQSINSNLKLAEEKHSAIKNELNEANAEYESKKTKSDELINIINGHKMLLHSREQKVENYTQQCNKISVEKHSVEARIRMLDEMEREFEGLGKAVKYIMTAVSRGTLQGVYGPVASLLTVEEKYALAIETALGSSLQNIVVESQECGKTCIELLKRNDSGRATFLPIRALSFQTLQNIPTGENGFLGIASSLISFDPKYDKVFAFLLGRTIVVDTLTNAIQISKKNANKLRIVTLDGQMINAGGSMTGGSTFRNSGILSRANELKKLQNKLNEIKSSEIDISDMLSEATRELTSAKYSIEVTTQEYSEAYDELHKAENSLAQLKVLDTTLNASIDEYDQEILQLNAAISENKKKVSEITATITKLLFEKDAVSDDIKSLTEGSEAFSLKRNQIVTDIASLKADYAALEAERSSLTNSMNSLKEVLDALLGDESQRQSSLTEFFSRITDFESELDEKSRLIEESKSKRTEITQQISVISENKMEFEGRRTRNDKLIQEKNKDILDFQASSSRLEQKKIAAEMEEKQILDKLWENYELSRSAAQALRQPVESMQASTKRISELKREIGKLGAVNIGAIDEFERVNERYQFLSGQRDDVEKAKRDLQKIISDITREMKTIFETEFSLINESFRNVFLDLFGGGKASLELEDPDDPLGCGIEIKVQPPGKAVTTISLLSGGEKSFVAIALYFAIMKVRPTPFCIMDEIDAALDEANVEKYADYMRSMTGETQFIVITHHRATMEEADVLYGVTMQERGVTTVLNVDLDEAEKTIA